MRGAASPTTPRTASLTAATLNLNAAPVPRNTETPTAPDANTELIARVGEALQSIGLDPAEFNLRVGAIEIVFPNKPTYDYPVLWANVSGTETPFYLQGAMQNPGMVAINISGMMGRPIMHLI